MPARAGEGPSTPGTEPALALREQACREIRSRIVSCSYRPGMQLNEAMVAAKVGLGRTPIRQAVDRLRLEGLVAIHPRQGVEVRGFATRPVPGGSGTPPGIAASLGQPAGRAAPSCPTRMSQSLSARSPSRHRQEPHPMPSEHRMNRPRRLLARWALTLALVGGALAAPSPASAQTAPAPTAQAAPSPVRGGSMVIINGSDIRTWDPAITSGTFPGGPMDVLEAARGRHLHRRHAL
jgi:hypothetical protein